MRIGDGRFEIGGFRIRYIATLVIFCGAFHLVGSAQESPKDSASIGAVLQSVFGKEGPNLGFVGQFDAEMKDGHSKTSSTFSTHLLRFYLYGSFGEKFAYVFQGDMKGGYQQLDLKFSYTLNDHLRIDAGQFKAPFGKEYLINDAKILFVNR